MQYQCQWQLLPMRSFVAVGVDPAVMGIIPAAAIPAAVKSAGLELDDIHLFEINEILPLEAKPWRSPSYNVVRIFFTTLIGLILGSVFWGMGSKRDSTQNLYVVLGAFMLHACLLESIMLPQYNQ
ncbi:hypothetical protein ACSBR1_037877 [Camellia fascicularis]